MFPWKIANGQNDRRTRNGGNSNFEMLNLEKCKKILQQNGKTYTDEEVKQIRNLLYKLGNLEYQLLIAKKQGKNG